MRFSTLFLLVLTACALNSCLPFVSPPFISAIRVYPNPMLPGEEFFAEAYLTAESGDASQFIWTFEDGTKYKGQYVQMYLEEEGPHVLTLKVRNGGGSDEMTHNILVVNTGTVTFYTNSQPSGSGLWRLRVNNRIETIDYRTIPGNQVECGNDAQPDRWIFDNIPLGPFTYELDKADGNGWQPYTIEIDQACTLVRLS